MISQSSHIHALLTATNLTIGYREGHRENSLLQNLNLSLHPGELVCFMGVNGIGKSTLIRTLAGLQKPLSGSILYSGEIVGEELPKKLSVVLTDKIAAPSMTVYELVSFGRYPYLNWTVRLNEIDKQIIERSIEQVHINHLREKRVYELSDGQLQLVMIARALSQDSEIILLDEPTAHLDLNNRIEIMNVLRNLSHTTNKAILIATHELDLTLQTADLIWLTGKNKNILTGIPEDLILNGSFDEVFQFKGFDLKTGKLQHHPHRNFRIQLEGDGHAYRWTKNALERTGYTVSDEADWFVSIKGDSFKPLWVIKNKGIERNVNTLKDLLALLPVK